MQCGVNTKQEVLKGMTSLDLTYDLIPAFSTLVVQRLNAIEDRIQSLMVFSSSFLLTGPALAVVSVSDVSFTSNWFYAAVFFSILNILAGLALRSIGTLHLSGPPKVESGWLELEVPEYKWSYIWWAGENFDHNLKLVNVKGTCALLMTGGLVAELTLLVVWGLSQTR